MDLGITNEKETPILEEMSASPVAGLDRTGSAKTSPESPLQATPAMPYLDTPLPEQANPRSATPRWSSLSRI